MKSLSKKHPSDHVLEDEQAELFVATTKDWKEFRENGSFEDVSPSRTGPRNSSSGSSAETRATNLLQAKSDRRTSFSQHVNLDLTDPYFEGRKEESRVVVVLSGEQSLGSMAVRPRAGQPHSGRDDSQVVAIG